MFMFFPVPSYIHFFFSIIPPPPTSTLFPYTTLFRSIRVSSLSGSFIRLPIPRGLRGAMTAVEPPSVSHQWASSRSEEHTSELQSHHDLVCRLLLEKKNTGPVAGHGAGVEYDTFTPFH